MKKTKKSLLFSGLALMMSALLLVGTTFAWFTDSVTNKGNTIQAGNLAVTFQYRDLNDANASWQAVPDAADEAGALFTDQLWEPGYSYGYDFKVSNPTGTLAFNYQLQVSNIQTTSTSGADIAKVLDVYVTTNDDATSLSDYTYVGTLDELRTGKVVFNSDKVMRKGFEDVFSVVIKMQDSAQNEYQNCGVTFDLNLLAKQASYEEDGFGNPNYDADAEYVDYNVTTAEELKTALENGGTAVLCNDIELNEAVTVSAKTLVLDLNGKELLYSAASTAGRFEISDGADVTIKNGIVRMPNAPYYGFYVKDTAKLTLDNIVGSSNDALVFGAGQETIVIRNCDLTTSYPIYHNGSTSPATLSIFDSYIKGGVYCSNAALPGRERQTLTIENSTIEGATAVEFKHTDATITNCTLVGTDTPTDSGSNNNGSCTSGYAVAVTTNGVDDYVTGNVEINNCKVYSGSVGEEENGYYFVYHVADGFSVTIDGEEVSDYNTYG